jgi:hypothetical protein
VPGGRTAPPSDGGYEGVASPAVGARPDHDQHADAEAMESSGKLALRTECKILTAG